MKAIKLTADQVRNSESRNYNPVEWDKLIDRYLKYKDVIFYHVPKDELYSYDRYLVVYTLPEGLRLMGEVSYSSSLTSGGFYRVDILPRTEDGRTFNDVVQLLKDKREEEALSLTHLLDDDTYVNIKLASFYSEGKEVLYNNSKGARQEMIEKSQKYGVIFAKSL